MLNNISDPNKLYDCAVSSIKSSPWKFSVQKYKIHLLSNIFKTEAALNSGQFSWESYTEFELMERGRKRHICSHTIRDRVVQLSISNNCLLPHVKSKLIYDNSASIKNKGISFARKRFKIHLRRFYEKYHTNEGYILQIDFKYFFESINHEKLLEVFQSLDLDEFNLFKSSIDIFSKGLGIGSPVSQSCGAAFPTKLDTFVTCVLGQKLYARYQDDSYIINKDKEELHKILELYTKVANSLGLIVNTRKTKIIKLTYSVTFLKVKYTLLSNGKILSRVVRATIVRERRKLKAYRRLYDSDKITFPEVLNNYKSWRGAYKRLMSRSSLRNLDYLFNELFTGEIYEFKERFASS